MSKTITLKDIKNYIEGNGRMFLASTGMLQPHITEQVAYRMLKCSDCLAAGRCQICWCHVPGRLYSDESCNKERFPDLMGEEEWIKFKQDNNINDE